ncbi:Peptide-N(4)-(N-acetyl-beta-glucosaminyl)asparagine amidase [Linum perenne]
MAARRFSVTCNGSTFDVDYDAGDSLEVFKFQLFSLTSIPPDQQKIIREDDGSVLSEDSDLLSVSDKLQLVSIDDEKYKEKIDVKEVSDGAVDVDALLKSDEELARMLQAEEEALMVQQYVVSEPSEQFEEKLRPYVDKIFLYEDPERQEAARKTVPVDELEEKALVSLAKEGKFKPTKAELDHAFLLQLLFWFKQSFRWVNAPPCDLCGNNTVSQGMGVPLPSETKYGGTRVELYRCHSCSTTSRFPRYNDPLKLLETRRGRCGEWANCFTLYCRAFGYETRLILDFTDHVWTECYSAILGRWMHLDPCEAVYDKPLLYEKGWGKKLNYVIGFSKDGVCDVTKRYTRKWPEVLSRRNITTELAVSVAVTKLTKECRRNFTSQVLSLLEVRDKSESDELDKGLNIRDDSSVSLPGRQSGNKEWRISRSEIGPVENGSISCSSCPTRICYDEHVTRVYDAIAHLLSQCVENSLPRPKVTELMNVLKKMLVDVRNSPHKTRRTTLNPFLMFQYPYFNQLLCALSLKIEIDGDGKVDLCLADEPVFTSLTLPVVLDALDESITNLDKIDHLNRASISLPLAKSNRIHSGLVLASGEEFPFGIVTSAFDGLRASKWEEPNGGKGGWILYSIKDSKKCELTAYEITSANDAPERDPKDWIVEGSDDGGSNWHILDRRTSELFEDRFQCRSFQVTRKGLSCNAFRDVQSNSRLQLCSINMYTNGE